ncbi:cache domain-containing sensor histidine kinase [Cohnella soli]|uniref:Sensor histidine kinase n=1 Tax=Cohnella soli TaxID=425005 RepID=A0ABW0HV78_9BACL
MFSFRTFQAKLFITYSIFLLIFTLIISVPMYFYLKHATEKNIIVGTQNTVSGISDNLDSYSRQYENMTMQIYLKNNPAYSNVIQSLQNLKSPRNDKEKLESYNSIENSIAILSAINSNVYRINIFNAAGLFFSNKPSDSPKDRISADHWLQKSRSAQGATVVGYFNSDRWVDSESPHVFSFMRMIKWAGTEIGYLEVQFIADDLISPDKLENLPGNTFAIFSDNDVLYYKSNEAGKNAFSQQIEAYRQVTTGKANGHYRLKNNGAKEIVVYQHAKNTSYTLLYAVPESRLFAPLQVFRNVTFLSIFALILLSILVFYILSKALTYPIKKLKKVIDTIDLDDKKIKISNEFRMDEIELLNRSFLSMNDRLQQSLEETVRFRTLQIQSHFEVLQAQINPHFLFNMLGVITIFSEEEGATKAAGVSEKLADFLRYTIIQADPITTLEQELKFVQDYLELMKTRYKHRLQFELTVPEEMNTILIPKLTLQPLVENAIHHGFQDIDRGLVVTISGHIEANRWYLTIRDNGKGMDPARLEVLNQEMQAYSDGLDSTTTQGERLALGGMGIISTYTRIRLYYKTLIDFKIGNNEQYGTYITISGFFQEAAVKGERQ